MQTCPKCGYARQSKDDDFCSAQECPKCGIVYEKYERGQEELNVAKMIVYVEKPGANRAYLWIAVALLFVAGIYIATSKGVHKTVPVDSRTKAAPQNRQAVYAQQKPNPANNSPVTYTAPPPVLQDRQTAQSQQKPAYSPGVSHATRPPYKQSLRDISNAAHGLSEAFNQPMDSSYYYHNDPDGDQYDPNGDQWDSIKSLPKYAKIQYILYIYHRSHAYVGNGFFVCVDMAMDVWDLLATEGIESRLMVGNVQYDITQSDTIGKYLSVMNHAWLLARVSPSTWIPLETTGGFIVQPSMWNFELYNKGAMFENPGAFKDFVESRKSMFMTCRQISPMQAIFDMSFAGKPVSSQGAEYKGRIMQELYDCQGLLGRVTALLQHR